MYIYIYLCECVCGVGDITTMKLSSKVRGLSLVTVMRPCGQFFFSFLPRCFEECTAWCDQSLRHGRAEPC